MEILLYSVPFYPMKSITKLIFHIQFSQLLSGNKEKNIISHFLISFTYQVIKVLFVDILNILTLHLFCFK